MYGRLITVWLHYVGFCVHEGLRVFEFYTLVVTRVSLDFNIFGLNSFYIMYMELYEKIYIYFRGSLGTSEGVLDT